MGVQYKNPPLIEALIDFKFSNDTTWDATIPGQLYGQIRTDFRKAPPRHNFHIAFDQSQMAAHLGAHEWNVFKHIQHNVLVQIAPQRLSINNIQPYLGWEHFRSIIESVFNNYLQILDQGSLESITLRYINHIHIYQETFLITDYFTLYPGFDTDKYSQFQGFIVGLQTPINDDRLKIELRSTSSDHDQRSAFILDLEYSIHRFTDRSTQDIHNNLELAHTTIEEAFYEVLTEKVIDTF